MKGLHKNGNTSRQIFGDLHQKLPTTISKLLHVFTIQYYAPIEFTPVITWGMVLLSWVMKRASVTCDSTSSILKYVELEHQGKMRKILDRKKYLIMAENFSN